MSPGGIVVQLHIFSFQARGFSSIQNDDRFPKGARGGAPVPIVQRRTFDTSNSWSFFTLGSSQLPTGSTSGLASIGSSSGRHSGGDHFGSASSRNKRKLLPNGKETISDFSCRGRPPGYYADIKLGCEVSHQKLFKKRQNIK